MNFILQARTMSVVSIRCIKASTWALVHFTYAQKTHLNAYAGVSNWTRNINIGPSLHLRLYFVYASSKGSGESAHLRKFARA